MGLSTRTTASKNTGAFNPKAAVPVLLISFIFSLLVDNGFKFISKPIADDLGLSVSDVSLQATLAGIVIGIGAVVYAALADSFSIRSLMIVGVGFIVVGSIIGFIFHRSWYLVLTGRIIQTIGLAAAETLYVIYVTKFLAAKDQKTYLGFSTASFQTALLFGALTSGIIATKVSWTWMFIVPLLMLVTIPFLLKKVPVAESTTTQLDVLGLLIIAVVATSIILYTQHFNPWWLIPIVVGIAVFVWHISVHEKAVVRPEFFANSRYVWALILVAIVYSVQLAYLFLFPFAVSDLYHYKLDTASLLIAPGYLCAAIVGALSGVIAKFLNSRVTIWIALACIVGALVIAAAFMEVSSVVLIISIVLFACAFALLYAPLLATAISTIPRTKSGIAIGFYNLTINIAIPVGIAYTAALIDRHPTFMRSLSTATTDAGASYSTVLWIVAAIALVGSIIYVVADAAMTRAEKRSARRATLK